MTLSVEMVPERRGEHNDGPYSLKCRNSAVMQQTKSIQQLCMLHKSGNVLFYPFFFDELGRAIFLTQGICATNEKSKFLPLIGCLLVCQSLFYKRVLLDD